MPGRTDFHALLFQRVLRLGVWRGKFPLQLTCS
jgi:hypothetical protein